MKHIAKLTLVLTAALALCVGCVHAPKTHLAGKVMDQPFSLSTASDMDLEGLQITAERDTNGVAKVSIQVSKANRHMNPDVISAQGQANAANAAAVAGLIQAVGPALGTILQQSAAGYATGGASLLAPKAVTPKP